MDSGYITVCRAAEAEITEKRSRFIAQVFPVKTEDEANSIIAQVRKKHHDARHNVFAFVLQNGNISRYTDDGEPSGTAGVPMLEIIRRRGITDCLVVVTRYFGGILLGTGGLARAYAAACARGLDEAGKAAVKKAHLVTIECDYADYDSVLRVAAQCGAITDNAEFLQNVKMYLKIKTELFEILQKSLNERFCGKINAQITGETELYEEL